MHSACSQSCDFFSRFHNTPDGGSARRAFHSRSAFLVSGLSAVRGARQVDPAD